ncbi:MAG: ribosome maturation factor RimP [Bacillota bacterium]
MKIVDRVTEMVEEIITDDELDLVLVEYVKEGSDWTLRVYIENIDGNLLIKDCTRISKALSARLDEEDFIEESYILEVSSPGVERPLRDEDDFHRFTGKNIFVRTYAPIEGQKEFTGRLEGLIDDHVEVNINNLGKIIKIPYNSIAKARLTVDL